MISRGLIWRRVGWLLASVSFWIGTGAWSEEKLEVACLGSDGKVKNALPEDVCKAILPKCSDLLSKNSKEVRRMLSMKIMGYYKGLDLDLDRSTKDNLVGASLSIPVCSVVGHDLSRTGDEELWQQSVGNRASCGKAPYMTGKSGSKRLYLRFQGDEGSAWGAWMMGAYPWGIRSASFDFLKSLNADLSNLDELLKSDVTKARKAEYAQVEASSRKFYRDLEAPAKAVCDSGATDVGEKCTNGGFSITDPAIRICTLYRAQLATSGAALSSLMTAEIVARAQVRHDSIFKSVIANQVRPGSGSNGIMNQLIHACNRYTYEGDSTGGGGCGYSRRHYLATVGSCLGNGTTYRAFASWHVAEGSSYTCRREGQRISRFSLTDGKILTSKGVQGGGWYTYALSPAAGVITTFYGSGLGGLTSGVNTSDPRLTRQNGFAGAMEFVIRKLICGAERRDISTPRCDTSEATGIPDKPSDISW